MVTIDESVPIPSQSFSLHWALTETGAIFFFNFDCNKIAYIDDM